jgi:hypothetical protein
VIVNTLFVPTLRGEIPYGDAPLAPCIWCGTPTDIRFVPEARPELGPQPLHMLCGIALIRAYERMLAGHILDAGTVRRLAAVNERQAASATALQRGQTSR